MDCIFCKIINKDVPTHIIYEDEQVVVFKDINPQAPIHLLIVPKEHIESIMKIDGNNEEIIKHIIHVTQKLARQYEISEKGFRLVVNTGEDGGQTVNHLHFHFLGNRFMTWPPG